MDFFGSQDQARGKTKQLVVLYLVAIIAIICCIYVVAVFAGFGTQAYLDSQSSTSSYGTGASRQINLLQPKLFLTVAGAVILVIGCASLYKIKSLGAGGAEVARSVGGREVDLSTRDPDERKLLNIVEEMSIASGVPMPDVFILDQEAGINAFAAGYSFEDAAVAVTKGAIQQLSRDELQGVMAHEFSHILSGDMRLNIRLIGPLFGLLVIAFIGRMLLYSSNGRSRSKEAGAIVFFGLAIMVIGYVGMLFGRLIQAAISRQREYLADAAAVQFTRNPAGISGALRRLGFGAHGSRVHHAHAEDTAHMFFAKALGSSFATHPPLPKRIRAIDPGWDGTYLPPRPPRERKEKLSASDRLSQFQERGRKMVTAATAVAAVGALSENGIRKAIEQRIRIRRTLGDLPIGTVVGAKTVFVALILDPSPTETQKQLAEISSREGDDFAQSVNEVAQKMMNLSAEERYGLMELSFPGLRKFSERDEEELTELLEKIAHRDGRITLREALVLYFIHRNFNPRPKNARASKRLSNQVAPLAGPIARLLFLVASLDKTDPSIATQRFTDAVGGQPLLAQHLSLPPSDVPVSAITEILDQIESSSFAIRKAIIGAAAQIILADDSVSDREWTFLRLVSLSLESPMPPLEGILETGS
ncbi:MAG: M48 family metallopeptidase [Verrucomicrobiota bacterium]